MPEYISGGSGAGSGSRLLLVVSVLLCCVSVGAQSAVAPGTGKQMAIKEFLKSSKDYSISLELYTLIEVDILKLKSLILIVAKNGGLQHAHTQIKGSPAKLQHLAKHAVLHNNNATNVDALVKQADTGTLISLDARPHTCYKYPNGLVVVSGGIVIEIHLLTNGVVLVVSLVKAEDARNMEEGLALLGINLQLGPLVDILLTALKTLLFGKENQYCSLHGCTVLIPSNERIELLGIDLSILSLAIKEESPLHYTFGKKYYPADFILLGVVVNLLGVELKISIILGWILQIGSTIFIDLTNYYECNDALLYSRPTSDQLSKISSPRA